VQQWARQARLALRGIHSRELVLFVIKDPLFIADKELGLNSALNNNALSTQGRVAELHGRDAQRLRPSAHRRVVRPRERGPVRDPDSSGKPA